MKNFSIRQTAQQLTLLMIFWLVMSGMFDLFHISLGVLSVIVVILLNYRILNYNFFHETEGSGRGFKYQRLPYFLLFLFKEIIVSALKVSYLIIHPKMPIKTCVAKFKVNLPNMGANVLLANSITLTPGTVSIDILGDNTFVVHSLSYSGNDDWIDHGLAFEVARLYGADPDRVVENEEIIASGDRI